MKCTIRVWITITVGLLVCVAGFFWAVLYLVNHGRGPDVLKGGLPFARSPFMGSPVTRSLYDGSTVVPPHRTLPPLKNVRWQPMPEDVIGVVAAPDRRIWTQLHSDEPLSIGAFKTMIEREYANPDPQFSGGLLLLAEPPADSAPHGRIWFELMHARDPRSRWDRNSHDEPWAVLLGYSGVPGSWIERHATKEWDFGNGQLFGWWNTCISRDARRHHCVALAGRAFFVHGGDVECFDGSNWTTKTNGRGPDNRHSVELMSEPDGKGIVVLQHETIATPTWDHPRIVPEHVWRWRDGDWKDVTLPEPVEWHIRDSRPTMGSGGMWICSRDGLWFSPFDGSAPPVASRVMGDFQWYNWARIDSDEQGRLYVRSEVIWKANQPQPPPHAQALLDEAKVLSDHRASYVTQRAADVKITLAKAGGVIVRETDGSCHFSPGDLDQPFGPQAQLPDEHFSVVEIDGHTLYAGWNTGASNVCPDPPVMVFNPDAPDNIVPLTHSPELDLDITAAGLVVDDAGGVITQKFQGDIVRFDGQAWHPIVGLDPVAALAFAAGHDGVLIVLAADKTWRLISTQSASMYASLEELVERNRDLIARAFFGIQLTGHECLRLSIAVDSDKNIYICCPMASLAKVLVGNSWQEVMTVSPSDVATIAAFSSRVYADRSGRVSNDARGLLAQVRGGVVQITDVPQYSFSSWSSDFAVSGPLCAADGSLWVSETNNSNLVGAVRIDPTGALTRFANMQARCADAGGAVFLSGPATSLWASTEMRVWQSGTATTPLPVRGIASGGYRMAPPPEMFAADPGSIWAFTAAGLSTCAARATR